MKLLQCTRQLRVLLRVRLLMAFFTVFGVTPQVAKNHRISPSSSLMQSSHSPCQKTWCQATSMNWYVHKGCLCNKTKAKLCPELCWLSWSWNVKLLAIQVPTNEERNTEMMGTSSSVASGYRQCFPNAVGLEDPSEPRQDHRQDNSWDDDLVSKIKGQDLFQGFPKVCLVESAK